MFKILFILFLIISFVPPVRRFLFWLIVGKQLNKEQKRANDMHKRKTRKEGDIKVDYVPEDTKGDKSKGGQYVDYEEVD